MRVGILTHPLDYNYGCLLQAFALQKTLKGMGYEVVTINRYSCPHRSFISLAKDWLRRIAKRILRNEKVSLSWNTAESIKIKDLLCTNTHRFVDRNIINTGKVFPKDLRRIDQQYKFDAYVVGSDQVWLPNFCLNCFLDFVERPDVKCVFYAASSGSTSFADFPKLSNKCKLLSTKFSGISVREDSLIPIVKDALERDAIQVLDPTLLLDADDYLAACIEKEDTTPVVFTYILDKTPEKLRLVNRVQTELNLPVVSGSVEKDYELGQGMDIQKCIYPSVDHWILNMARAAFVVTDSFHGTCMAITFRKPFVVIGNRARGINRFVSILKQFGLEGRLISGESQFSSDLYSALDDEMISNILSVKRKESIQFLHNNLSR